ncbi:syncytin-1-like [Dasypus novemcinctus]|uniref:syncytin-1-like n=1 Tax=Dasypus novemcinctus TaxID=9361 RepID=UPI00265FEDDB|nr:syncytin-1-like [Dasypus novemcinctus]
MGPPPNLREVLKTLYGTPCECRGGQVTTVPHLYTRSVQCNNNKVAYLQALTSNIGGYTEQQWVCRNLPRIIPSEDGCPGPCTCKFTYPAMHVHCYSEVQSYTRNNKTYYTAILARTKFAVVGGDWSNKPSPLGNSKLTQAGCYGTIGDTVCWNKIPPAHISDGGGPQDQARQIIVQERMEEIIKNTFPQIEYHPLALPKTEDLNLDAQTFRILESTFKLLNLSQPYTAQNCWLCLRLGTSIPIALPVSNNSYQINSTCLITPPIRVQPIFTYTNICLHSPSTNNTNEIPLGHLSFALCNSTRNTSDALCANHGAVFVCGGNFAYTFLPHNWTGTCTLATLFPDVSIINGTEPVPVPSMDYIASRSKRAVQLIPLFVTLGVSGALATGTAGLGLSLTQYTQISNQLVSDVRALSNTIKEIQDQIDSFADVVLQNRRGLDLLTAERGGICLALQEQCCFYVNKSGIVRDKIKRLQEDLDNRRRELSSYPSWSGFRGILPYLLPVLGPLITILLVISFGPWAVKRIIQLVKDQVDSALGKPIQVHYHRLHLTDQGISMDHPDCLPYDTNSPH